MALNRTIAAFLTLVLSAGAGIAQDTPRRLCKTADEMAQARWSTSGWDMGTAHCTLLSLSKSMALECLHETDVVTTGDSVSLALHHELDHLLRGESILLGATSRSTEIAATCGFESCNRTSAGASMRHVLSDDWLKDELIPRYHSIFHKARNSKRKILLTTHGSKHMCFNFSEDPHCPEEFIAQEIAAAAPGSAFIYHPAPSEETEHRSRDWKVDTWQEQRGMFIVETGNMPEKRDTRKDRMQLERDATRHRLRTVLHVFCGLRNGHHWPKFDQHPDDMLVGISLTMRQTSFLAVIAGVASSSVYRVDVTMSKTQSRCGEAFSCVQDIVSLQSFQIQVASGDTSHNLEVFVPADAGGALDVSIIVLDSFPELDEDDEFLTKKSFRHAFDMPLPHEHPAFREDIHPDTQNADTLMRAFANPDKDCGANIAGKVLVSDRFGVGAEHVGLPHFLQGSFSMFGCLVPAVHLDADGLIVLAPSIKRLKMDVGLSYTAHNSQLWLDTVPDLAVFGFEPNAQAVRELLSGVGWDRGTGKRPMADRHEITGTGTLHAGEVAYLDPAHIGGRFFLFPVAVGNNSGNALFYDTPRDPSTSSLHQPNGTEKFGDFMQYQVPVLRLADVMAHIPWGFDGQPGKFAVMEHLKIDAQGFDVQVLKGAGQYLRDRVVCVQAEREASGYMGGHTPEELLEYMAASDFQLVSQTDNDVIFVNNRLLGWLSEVAFCGGLGYQE